MNTQVYTNVLAAVVAVFSLKLSIRKLPTCNDQFTDFLTKTHHRMC